MRFLVLFLILVPALSMAEPRAEIPAVTEIDFGTVDVKADVVGPDGQIVHEPRRPKFNPLIRLRTNFDDEIARSIAEIR
ncbi:MAG: hypothetical protein EP330_05855 [Deltaproteobacteria bacterium]|nr:MAG: hypothetical protein EP330_05855 [Deltaproteobacteria bacterium]